MNSNDQDDDDDDDDDNHRDDDDDDDDDDRSLWLRFVRGADLDAMESAAGKWKRKHKNKHKKQSKEQNSRGPSGRREAAATAAVGRRQTGSASSQSPAVGGRTGSVRKRSGPAVGGPTSSARKKVAPASGLPPFPVIGLRPPGMPPMNVQQHPAVGGAAGKRTGPASSPGPAVGGSPGSVHKKK